MARDLGMPGSRVHAKAAEVLRFWFDEVGPDGWYAKDADQDAAIAARFGPLRRAVVESDARDWRGDAPSLLAAVILIDQFSRNIFRNSAEAFAADPLARSLAEYALAQGWDTGLNEAERQFLYLPFMHGEDGESQARSVLLCERLGGEPARFARLHAAQIARFGRFPQRNSALGRVSTPEEQAFLENRDNLF